MVRRVIDEGLCGFYYCFSFVFFPGYILKLEIPGSTCYHHVYHLLDKNTMTGQFNDE